MKLKCFLLLLIILTFALNACGGLDALAPEPTATPLPTAASGYSSGGKIGNHASLFPIPTNVYNYMVLNPETLNYATSLNFDEIIAYYTKEFDNAGLTVRENATEINDLNFTMIWDGHDSGRAILLQGLDLENGSYNVILKFVDM